MATKKARPVEDVKPTPAEPAYPKSTLMRADRWDDRKDLLNALLDEGKVYTINQVDQMIDDFLSKEV